jgi:hypothetical protein
MGDVSEYPWLDPHDNGPTPPLDEYLAAEVEDSNVFWQIGCGHHQNLLDMAVEQRDEARVEVERLTRWKSEATIVLAAWDAVYDGLGQPGRLGQSKADAVLAEVERRQATIQRVRELPRVYGDTESLERFVRVSDLDAALDEETT